MAEQQKETMEHQDQSKRLLYQMQYAREEQERNAKAHLEMQQKQNQALIKELEI